jgi:hypothetical protein
MDLNLKRKKIRLTYEGLKCEILIPTTKEVIDLQTALKKKNVDEVKELQSFLKNLGMTDEVLDVLDIMSLEEIIKTIGGKKNLSQS